MILNMFRVATDGGGFPPEQGLNRFAQSAVISHPYVMVYCP